MGTGPNELAPSLCRPFVVGGLAYGGRWAVAGGQCQIEEIVGAVEIGRHHAGNAFTGPNTFAAGQSVGSLCRHHLYLQLHLRPVRQRFRDKSFRNNHHKSPPRILLATEASQHGIPFVPIGRVASDHDGGKEVERFRSVHRGDDGGKAILIGMAVHHLAQARQPEFPPRGVVTIHACHAADDFAAVVRSDDKIAKQQPHGTGEITHGDSVGGKQFEHPARAHALRLFHRVEINPIAVALVGSVDLGERQMPDNERTVDVRKMVGRVCIAKFPVVNLHRLISTEGRDDLLQIPRAFRKANIKGTGKAKGVFSRIRFDGVRRGRLAGKRQQIDSPMPDRLPIAGNAINIGGEYPVKLLRSAEKTIEVNGILLVPKDRGHAVGTAPGDHPHQLVTGATHFILPLVVLPAPCRFDKEHLRPKHLQFLLPVTHRELQKLAFRCKGTERELIRDRRHAQQPKSGGTFGALIGQAWQRSPRCLRPRRLSGRRRPRWRGRFCPRR